MNYESEVQKYVYTSRSISCIELRVNSNRNKTLAWIL